MTNVIALFLWQVLQLITICMTIIVTIMAFIPNRKKKLLLTRYILHAIGGALATLAAVYLSSSNVNNVRHISFGSPRVGNAAAASYMSHVLPMVRTTHFRDIVPHNPFISLGYTHVTTEWYENMQGKKEEKLNIHVHARKIKKLAFVSWFLLKLKLEKIISQTKWDSKYFFKLASIAPSSSLPLFLSLSLSFSSFLVLFSLCNCTYHAHTHKHRESFRMCWKREQTLFRSMDFHGKSSWPFHLPR